MTDEKIVESEIKKDTSVAETDPRQIRELDGTIMPWQISSAFKALHVTSVLSERGGGVDASKVAEELQVDEMRVIALIKLARTVIANPMPGALSRVSAMYDELSDAVYAIKNQSSDSESVRLATEALGRVEGQEPEETPPEAIEAFKKEMEKRGAEVTMETEKTTDD